MKVSFMFEWLWIHTSLMFVIKMVELLVRIIKHVHPIIQESLKSRGSVLPVYLWGWAEPRGYKPAAWTGSTGRVSSWPRASPEPAAGDAAAAPRWRSQPAETETETSQQVRGHKQPLRAECDIIKNIMMRIIVFISFKSTVFRYHDIIMDQHNKTTQFFVSADYS